MLPVSAIAIVNLLVTGRWDALFVIATYAIPDADCDNVKVSPVVAPIICLPVASVIVTTAAFV